MPAYGANYGVNNGMYNNVPTYPTIQPNIGSNYYQGQPGRSVIPGRTVSNVKEITIEDVPRDGSMGIFPKNDGNCIWVKYWTDDGNIRTMKFVPSEEEDESNASETDQTSSNSGNNDLQSLINTVNNTNDMVSCLMDMFTTPSNSKNQNGSENSKKGE